MKLTVHEDAAKWYKEEMGLEDGDYVRIFTKLYGGIKTIFPSYFLGVLVGKEGQPAAKDEVAGITFYIKKEDQWILNEHDLEVQMGEDEAEFVFKERK